MESASGGNAKAAWHAGLDLAFAQSDGGNCRIAVMLGGWRRNDAGNGCGSVCSTTKSRPLALNPIAAPESHRPNGPTAGLGTLHVASIRLPASGSPAVTASIFFSSALSRSNSFRRRASFTCSRNGR